VQKTKNKVRRLDWRSVTFIHGSASCAPHAGELCLTNKFTARRFSMRNEVEDARNLGTEAE
jgi:hypothetical protein